MIGVIVYFDTKGFQSDHSLELFEFKFFDPGL
jgi:hypothetical protein